MILENDPGNRLQDEDSLRNSNSSDESIDTISDEETTLEAEEIDLDDDELEEDDFEVDEEETENEDL